MRLAQYRSPLPSQWTETYHRLLPLLPQSRSVCLLACTVSNGRSNAIDSFLAPIAPNKAYNACLRTPCLLGLVDGGSQRENCSTVSAATKVCYETTMLLSNQCTRTSYLQIPALMETLTMMTLVRLSHLRQIGGGSKLLLLRRLQDLSSSSGLGTYSMP